MTSFDKAPGAEMEQTPAQRLTEHKKELLESGIYRLEERIEHNLDPAGMLAVTEVRERVEKVMESAGINLEELKSLTNALHVGAIWKEAGRLAEATDPDIRGWMLLADITQEENNRDMSQVDQARTEYLADVDRIIADLDTAMSDANGRIQAAIDNIKQNVEDDFTIEDGIPYSDNTDAFLSMAIKGEVAGIAADGDLLFVAANALNYEAVIQELGLRTEVRNENGKDVTYYVRDGGGEIKYLYPGLSIVMGGDKDLAVALAKTGQQLAASGS